jgi:dephospho-CoA kinase
MIRPQRFALVGKSGSGKSEACRFLCESREIRLIKTGAICRQIARLLFDNEDKRSTQLLDDALSSIDPSIFLRAAMRGVSPDDCFVIDALRFREDLVMAREAGCMVIRIVASDEIRLSRLVARGQAFDPETDGRHRSEVELDDAPVDLEIRNEGEKAAFIGQLTGLPA